MPEYRQLTDEQLEEILRRLPPRELPGAFRSRVVDRPAHLRWWRGLLRPRHAVAALAVLLLADVAVVKLQDRTARPVPASPVVAQVRERDDADVVALLSDLGGEQHWRVARLLPPRDDRGYLRLRTRVLDFSGKG